MINYLVLICLYLSFEIKNILDKRLCHLESSYGVHDIPHLFLSKIKNCGNVILYITELMHFAFFLQKRLELL